MSNDTEKIFIPRAEPSQSSAFMQNVVDAEISGNSLANLDNVEDFSHMCRTCATVTEFVIPIFAGEGLHNKLAEKIHKHLPIQVCESDVLPRALCYQCASTLLAWHELVQCCVQADVALRARLPKEPMLNIKSNSTVEDEIKTKYTIRQYLAMDPPQYPARRVRQRLCVYCPTLHAHAVYEKHLITAHSERLFHCEECHKYIDKKEFVIHMSLHAIEYSANLDKKKLQKVEKKEQFDGNENNEESETVQNDNTVQELKMAKANENLRNEFSDHSDMEFGLEPLPESVFKAIEDSQDSQSLEEDTIQTPKNECLSDESQPVDNLSNSADTASPPNEDNNSPAPETNDHNSETKKGDHKKLRTCPICSKVYKASSSYFYHLKYFHKRSRDHECGVCQKKFGTKATLTQHMAIHSGQYEFECNQCKKQFKSKASLYIHEQTHNGKKSWSCNQCQTSFRWKTHLSRHMTRHTAKKGHVCATCGRGFSIRCDLLRHARTHNAGNFTCDKCDLKFAQLRYLKAHTTKKHSA